MGQTTREKEERIGWGRRREKNSKVGSEGKTRKYRKLLVKMV